MTTRFETTGRCSVSGDLGDPRVVSVFMDRSHQVSCAQYSVGSHQASVAADDHYDLRVHRHASGRLLTQQNKVETSLQIQSGTLGLSPAQVDATYDFTGQTTTNSIAIHSNVFDHVIASDIGLSSKGVLEPTFGWRNATLSHLVMRHFDVMVDHDLAQSIEAEMLGFQIASELLRFFGPQKGALPSYILSPEELQKVIDYVDDCLATNIGVSSMAAVLNQDVFRFSKGFKAASGLSPHKFVIRRRLERAIRYLEVGSISLSEIAYACGFSSQAHMTSVFTKYLGQTPGRMRREFS
ncbi:MAG: AraC family transcriptional regulator [Pseudomonadota bacterium]